MKKLILYFLIILIIPFVRYASASEKITLQLRWDHQFQFAGYYAAKWNGYYSEEGLDVHIKSAVTPERILSAVEEVGQGRADFGIGSADILKGIDNNYDLVLVASIFQHSASGFYTRKDTVIKSPVDFLTLKVARRVNDLIDIEFQAMLKAEGINPDDVTPYPHQPGMGHLISGKVDVAPGYSINIPFTAETKGITINEFRPIKYGIDFYGDSLFTSGRLIQKQHSLVQKFRDASIKGWEYALEHKEEMIKRISSELKRVRKVDHIEKFNRYQSENINKLVHYPEIEIGHINPARWDRMNGYLKSLGIVQQSFNLEQFVYDPEKLERIRSARKQKILTVILATAVAIILSVLLWVRVLRLSVARKTKELYLTNQSLRLSEERFKMAIEANNDGLWDWNIETGDVYYSPAYFAMLGYEEAKVPDHINSWKDLIHPDDKERAMMANLDCMENRSNKFQVEFRMQAKYGEWRWILSQGKAVARDERGKATRIIGTHHDITERIISQETIRENEARFRGYFELGLIGMAVTSPDKKWLQFNDFICQMLGYPRDELIKLTWEELTHPEDLENDLFHFNKVVKGKIDSYSIEKRFVHKKGHDVFTQLSVHCVRKPDKAVDHFVVMLQDMTERKKNELALKDSRERYRLIAENTSDSIWSMDANLKFTYLSPSTEKLFGYTTKEWETLDWDNYVHPDYMKNVLDVFDRLQKASEGKSITAEALVRHKNGDNMWVEFTASSIWSNGCPIGFVGVTRDVTDRKQVEIELKESEERFKALHNASFGGITIHDKGVILECNKGMSEITGFEYSELIGMNGLELISGDTRDVVIQNINAGYEKPYEAKGLRKNGEIYPLRLEARNIPYKGEDVRVVEFRDISDVKNAEKEKNDLENQLQQSQKMEAVGRLAGGVAHDFNNMLGVILGHAEMIKEQIEPKLPFYDGLEEILSAANRSVDLTRQLLAFARKQTITPKVIDLNEIIDGMTNMLQRVIGENVSLIWKPSDNLSLVKADPSQIDQIIVNLCVNARDAISGVGELIIETGNADFDKAYSLKHPGFSEGEFILLSVSDDGCGMETETLSNIFEPFFTTKESGKGTGLGLATVYGAVKQNKGFINVSSEPGQGTTFTIYLPRYKDHKDQLQEKVSKLPLEKGTETVLLVEDEASIMRMTKMMLERLGYRVITANTPGEAISLAHEYAGEIDLLMTDVVMPEMNGRDLAKNILSYYPNLKRLFMSGYTADVIAHHGVLDAGVNFIQKPFSKEDLGRKLREVIRKEGTG